MCKTPLFELFQKNNTRFCCLLIGSFDEAERQLL